MIEQIKNHVEDLCKKESNPFGYEIYPVHFTYTVKYALHLADKTGADKEIVEIAGWLHDVGSCLGYYEDHHTIGAQYAADYLGKLGLSYDKIEQVKHCIEAHRGSKDIPRKTIEAVCVADGDACSHFDDIAGLFHLAFVIRNLDTEKSRKFVRGKLERSWNKLSPQGKHLMETHYHAVRLLF